MSLAKNIDFLRHLPKLNGFNGFANYGLTVEDSVQSPLVEVTGFGSNPGELRMLAFAPDHLPKRPALVVVLHGCGQTAAGYDIGAGWSMLARRYGFALLMPEQQSSNNAHTCFNWFNPEDIAREQGEACSIRQMVARMAADHKIDPRRIFVTGISAGGAMTSVMLATYPEVFAAGAVIAGLPYGIAGNVREALSGMLQSTSRPAEELGDMVRQASAHKGPWPKMSVWHGTADRTVNPANANEIVKQWLDLHGLPVAPMAATDVDGHPREVWWNAEGETIVESYTITDMAHGTPLGIAGNDEPYGEEGAFLIETGISSSYHIANFFGLTERVRQPNEAVKESVKEPVKEIIKPISKEVAKPISAAAPKRAVDTAPPAATESAPDLAVTLRPQPRPARQAGATEPSKRRAIDVGAVITRALTAAGLMK